MIAGNSGSLWSLNFGKIPTMRLSGQFSSSYILLFFVHMMKWLHQMRKVAFVVPYDLLSYKLLYVL